MSFYESVEIVRYDVGGSRRTEDIVVKEYPLTLLVGGREFVTLLCTPRALDYLVMGFLLSEGFIKEYGDIRSLKVDKKRGIAEIELRCNNKLAEKLYGSRTITSGCSRRPVFYNVKSSIDTKAIGGKSFHIGYEYVLSLMKQFDNRAEIFKKTGGVHSCGLGSEGEIEVYHEDIGRHNAMDKILGHGLAKDVDFSRCIILTSGRISSEMLIKAARRAVPIIASKSAPTMLALELAQKLNITLIGFVRGKRLNVYTAFHRVVESNG